MEVRREEWLSSAIMRLDTMLDRRYLESATKPDGTADNHWNVALHPSADYVAHLHGLCILAEQRHPDTVEFHILKRYSRS